MVWKAGRGKLGLMKPLLGDWKTVVDPQATGPNAVHCTRSFTSFGQWIVLDAHWQMGAGEGYRERAFFGAEDGGIAVHSFTNDGKCTLGRIADGSDISAQAIAFEAQMPAGLARMLYWPHDDGTEGFRFAVESRTKKGWNRFLLQRFVPA